MKMSRYDTTMLIILIVLLVSGVITLPIVTNSPISVSKTDDDSEYEFVAPQISENLSMDFVMGKYDKVKEAAEELHKNYPDSYDDKMAQEYVKLIEKNEKETEDAVADIDFKNYIQLLSVKTDEPNSAGGVNLHIIWKNTSDKTVKYAHFTCDLYNAVDDKVADTITRNYSQTGTVTGPIEPGAVYGKNYLWENFWWNNTGRYAKITKIRLEYMDGTEIKIPQGRIDELFY